MDAPLAQYVEDVALFFEAGGLPRIAGRIFAYLLVSDPPHRTAAELAEAIGASKGSISTMTRLLLNAGLIERVAIPGERATYFCADSTGFERRFEASTATLGAFLPIADRGLALLKGESAERRRPLRELRELHAFFHEEMPRLLEKWRRQQKKKAKGKTR